MQVCHLLVTSAHDSAAESATTTTTPPPSPLHQVFWVAGARAPLIVRGVPFARESCHFQEEEEHEVASEKQEEGKTAPLSPTWICDSPFLVAHLPRGGGRERECSRHGI